MEKGIVSIFLAGYAAVAFEHPLKINKAASALLTGMLCWTLYILGETPHSVVLTKLIDHLGDITGILFFLMGAMTIVELIDVYGGFDFVTDRVTAKSKRSFLWLVGGLCFFLSAILDNLTTTIVMISFITKYLREREDQLIFAGLIIISANAGGAWSPIGDVTTTMLWMGGRLSSFHLILKLLLPSLVCVLIPLIWMTFQVQGPLKTSKSPEETRGGNISEADKKFVFFLGLGLLLFVPVFKMLTGLPPFMGMLLSLGLLWLITDILNHRQGTGTPRELTVAAALRRIDVSSILFFLGILLAVAALQSIGLIDKLAHRLDSFVPNSTLLIFFLGLVSAVVDNVPLVSTVMSMYDVNRFPMDHSFWEFLAYCSGTGGSLLSIGSAAGVAAIGLLRIDFFWYIRKIFFVALGGYIAGAVVYLLFIS